MKYTHGKDRRQGSHLTDLIGDGPMLCYVLWIVFTLFLLFLLGSKYPVSPGPMVRLLSLLFFSIGLPVPRFSGPLESLCTFFRVTNSKNSTDSSGVHWSGVHWSWYVLKCSLEPLFYALLFSLRLKLNTKIGLNHHHHHHHPPPPQTF